MWLPPDPKGDLPHQHPLPDPWVQGSLGLGSQGVAARMVLHEGMVVTLRPGGWQPSVPLGASCEGPPSAFIWAPGTAPLQ